MAKKQPSKKASLVKADLLAQLGAKKKSGLHYEDLIGDYIYLLDLKDRLQKDIDLNGLRIETPTGNGFPAVRPNESVQNILKVTAQMLKLLSELDLQEPVVAKVESSKDDYLPGN